MLLQHGVMAQAEARPDATAIVFKGGRTTYRELEEDSNRLANALQESGCVPGDRVAILSRNNPQWLMAIKRAVAMSRSTPLMRRRDCHAFLRQRTARASWLQGTLVRCCAISWAPPVSNVHRVWAGWMQSLPPRPTPMSRLRSRTCRACRQRRFAVLPMATTSLTCCLRPVQRGRRKAS